MSRTAFSVCRRYPPQLADSASCGSGPVAPCPHLPELGAAVRPGTLLGLELILQQPSIDLDSLVALLEADEGAALRVAQLAACEAEAQWVPTGRLADCVASLELVDLFLDLSQHVGR